MRKLALLLFTTLLILSGCENKEELKNKEELVKKEYIKNAETIQTDIISSAAEAENIIYIYSNVWSTAIQEELTLENYASILDTDETELDTFLTENNQKLLPNNSFSKIYDFNLALLLTQLYLTENQKINSIEASREDIRGLIKKLNSPPNEFKDLYDEIFELYGNYDKYIELATAPSGSLTSYNDAASELSSEIISGINKVEAKLPEKVQE